MLVVLVGDALGVVPEIVIPRQSREITFADSLEYGRRGEPLTVITEDKWLILNEGVEFVDGRGSTIVDETGFIELSDITLLILGLPLSDWIENVRHVVARW